ncbi:MAG: hypothetical protein ACYDGR_06720 [Candidatus Dormibacteria bacterium]
MFLTAAHVVGSLNPVSATTKEVFTVGGQLVGTVDRSIPDPLTTQGGNILCHHDAALIRPAQGVQCTRRIGGIKLSGTTYSTDQLIRDVAVLTKQGASTGKTEGCILSANADFWAQGPAGQPLHYPSGLLIDCRGQEVFAASGDSGAVVIDRHGALVALIVGVFPSTKEDPFPSVFCLPIAPLLKALKVEAIGA